jgi:hypothetical protein
MRPAPCGNDFSKSVDRQNCNQQDKQPAVDEGRAEQQEVSGEKCKRARQISTRLGASRRCESDIGLCNPHRDQRKPENRK